MTKKIDDHIQWTQLWPLPHMEGNGGLLPRSVEAAALWQFLVCATTAIRKIPNQVTLEGDPDIDVDLNQLADSCRRIFRLKSLDGMFNVRLIQAAKREATRCLLYWPPRLDNFFDSGGRESKLTRSPDDVGFLM